MRTRVIQNEPPEPPSPRTATGPVDEPHVGSRSAGRSVGPARRLVRRHPLATFFVLSYAIAWSAWPFGSFLAISPLVAALVVVTATDGVAGLQRLGSRLIRWRVGWVWYAVAIAVPLAVHLMSIGANMAAGAPAPSLAQFTPWYSVLLVFAVRLVNPLDGPLGEEPGWRGVAQPGLQARRSPLRATTVLAVLVALWHLPLVLMPEFDLPPLAMIITFVVTFWYAWLFNRTGGSVLLTLIAHDLEGSINTSAWWPAGAAADRHVWMWLGAWVVVVAALLAFDRRAWTHAPAPAADRGSRHVPSEGPHSADA